MSGFLAAYPADLAEWERDERLLSRGFVHPWRSRVAAGNGEVFFDALVRDSLRADATVLDVGCGHGTYAMSLAASCDRVIGVDREARVLELARELAAERGVRNVEFVPDEPTPALPVADRSVDLIVCRRGPTIDKWLPLALRVAKPGTVVLGIHPPGAAGGIPPWNDELPEQLRIDSAFGYYKVRSWLTKALAAGPATLHSCWWFDVPEVFDDPEQLYARLAWGQPEAPSYDEVSSDLTALFDRRGGHVELRHARLVWRVDLGIE